MSGSVRILSDEDQSDEPVALVQSEEPWSDCNLLTFDGGGIRGFWSLLVMKQLMDHVAELEMKHKDGKAPHSFWPQAYPEGVSQLSAFDEETRKRAVSDANSVEWLDASRRYLPCHYFDYIGGTSTGALIAIMLGRLRMTVLDCLYEYAKMGGTVFAGTSFLRKVLTVITPGTKHRTSGAVEAFKDVIRRRGEDLGHAEVTSELKFPSGKYMCQTFVTTLLSTQKGVQGKPYVLKSYESPVKGPGNHVGVPLLGVVRKRTVYATDIIPDNSTRRPTRVRRDFEQAHDLEIYRVARAATAATKYFEPERVPRAQGGEMTFEDGGLLWSNPTQIGMREIKKKHGNNKFGVVVSVGTAKADYVQEKDVGKEFVTTTMRRISATATYPDRVHEEVESDCRDESVEYYRLNPRTQDHRLRTVLDEWEPKSSMFGQEPGSQTLCHIKSKFKRWYNSDPAIKAEFLRCAEELVERRRKRAGDPAKWERYVKGSHFQCQIHECDRNDRKFTFMDRFLEHCKQRPRLHYDGTPSKALDDELIKESRYDGWTYQQGRVDSSRLAWLL